MSEQSFTPGKLVLKRATFRPTFFVMREGYTSDEAGVAEVIDPRYAPLFAASPALLEALKAADQALTQFTAFEADARHIMGNTNFAIVQQRREQIRAAISQAEGRDHG